MAVGCVGMSYNDFCRCTPGQLKMILDRWSRKEKLMSRERWEQTRFLATTVLQPYAKKALKPTDVAKFKWEKDQKPKVPLKQEESTLERFRQLVEARGKK